MLLKVIIVDSTYNKTADDVVFTKPLAKVCKLTVSRFLSCSSISEGKWLLTYDTTEYKGIVSTLGQTFLCIIHVKHHLDCCSHQAECCSG